MSAIELVERASLADVAAEDWNALAPADFPFTDYEFLRALELAGCVGEATAWRPRHLLAYRAGALAGATPYYHKLDSYGEYVFDHEWAAAYQRAGLSYYPKGLSAAPFTPANGDRLLTRADDPDAAALQNALAAALQTRAAAEGLSSVHCLFHSVADRDAFANAGYLERVSIQYHWENRGYATFEDFLADLRSQKRKQIKKERRAAAEHGLRIELLTGDAIQPEHMEAMFAFYMDTGSRKWGRPYLNREWFRVIHALFRERIVLLLAFDGDRPVAGTLNFRKGRRLFGRYWGAAADYSCLHFELCYYRLIEYAIQEGIELFEAGAQGEHKFLRGFAARPCYSSHWIVDPAGRAAIARFLDSERAYMSQAVLDYNEQSPLKPLRSGGVEITLQTASEDHGG